MRENEANETTLRDVARQVWAWAVYLWAYKWWVLLPTLGVGIGVVYRAWQQPFTYTARTTFMVNEESGGSSGGLGAILGQFGLGMGTKSDFNLDKIVELGRSRQIIQQALLDSAEINGQTDLLANHIIRIQALQEEWVADSLLQTFLFTRSAFEDFNRVEKKALLQVYATVLGSVAEKKPGLLQLSYLDESGILELSVKTRSEALSLALNRQLYLSLSNFYIKKTTEKQRETVQMLDTKVDSIYRALASADYSLAQTQDQSLGIIQKRGQVNQGRLSREVQLLTIMYGEAIKNRETADFLLRSTTPFFQLIDEAMEPLKKERKSILKPAILWSFLAFLFLGAVVLLRGKLLGQLVDAGPSALTDH